MRLTLWTDYALRTLIFVGAKGDQLATIAEIATSFDVSKTHLMKVVNQLGQLGYLETVRGKGGGVEVGTSALGNHRRDGRAENRGRSGRDGLPRTFRVLPD